MDINCVNKCKHQDEGKCMLNQLPSLSQSISFSGESDCPYCVKPER